MAMQRDGFHDFVLDQLADVRGVQSRAMFGGHGLYSDEVFFAILFKGRLYFKVSSVTRPRYEALGMTAFRPNRTQTLTSFYEVPVEIIEQPEELAAWATEAIAAGRRPSARGTARARESSRRPQTL